VAERTEYIQSLKMRIDEMKATRQDVNMFSRSYEQAITYFNREFKVSPEESSAEIMRMETEAVNLTEKSQSLRDKLPPLLVDRDAFKAEYQSQMRKLLADISRDRQRILNRLEQLEKETRNKLSPKEYLARLEITSRLNEPEREKVRERDRYRSR